MFRQTKEEVQRLFPHIKDKRQLQRVAVSIHVLKLVNAQNHNPHFFNVAPAVQPPVLPKSDEKTLGPAN